jgi:hypothetical protein
MGYYTVHTALTPMAHADYKILKDLNPMYDYEDIFEGESCKWYSAFEDMKLVSKASPKKLFVIECKGEDGDVWRMFHQDGLGYCEKPSSGWQTFSGDNLVDEDANDSYQIGEQIDLFKEDLNRLEDIKAKLSAKDIEFLGL